MNTKVIDILFDGPPSHGAPRFVEVESPPGTSIKFGEWVERDGGYYAIRFQDQAAEIESLTAESRRLHRELEAARALIERKDASMKQDADVFCAHTDINVKRLAELEHQLAGFRWHRVEDKLPPIRDARGLPPHVLVCAVNRQGERWGASVSYLKEYGGFDHYHGTVTHWREIGELPSALPTGASELLQSKEKEV